MKKFYLGFIYFEYIISDVYLVHIMHIYNWTMHVFVRYHITTIILTIIPLKIKIRRWDWQIASSDRIRVPSSILREVLPGYELTPREATRGIFTHVGVLRRHDEGRHAKIPVYGGHVAADFSNALVRWGLGGGLGSHGGRAHLGCRGKRSKALNDRSWHISTQKWWKMLHMMDGSLTPKILFHVRMTWRDSC